MRSLQENYPPNAFYGALNLIGSHDRARILTLMGNAPEGLSELEKECYRLDDHSRWMAIRRVKLLTLLQFTAPGIPCIYYGDEAGMEGYDDPFNRGPYPWGRENQELMRHYRDLTQLRQAHSVLASGNFLPLAFAAVSMAACAATRRSPSSPLSIGMMPGRRRSAMKLPLPSPWTC